MFLLLKNESNQINHQIHFKLVFQLNTIYKLILIKMHPLLLMMFDLNNLFKKLS